MQEDGRRSQSCMQADMINGSCVRQRMMPFKTTRTTSFDGSLPVHAGERLITSALGLPVRGLEFQHRNSSGLSAKPPAQIWG